LANCGYLPILIEFAHFRKCCIFSHFGKGSPFWHVNNFVFFSGKLLILIILATLPILAILNGFGIMDEQKLFNFF
jgi:hypothetical protein